MNTPRYLGMTPKTSPEWLESLKSSNYLDLGIDAYNSGDAVMLLEQRTAKLLGKQRGLFFPKGMAAQFAMLKAAEEHYGNSNIVLHPLSHLAWDEKESFRHLLQLNGLFRGQNNQPFTANELVDINLPVATVMVELPLRRAGFRLTAWDELVNIARHCKEHGSHFHIDGARLWESAHYYLKSEAEIAALADTVYVSFYKGLGGMGGAILAGDESFIERCVDWRSRLAGDQFTAFPQIISALDGLDNNRDKIGLMIDRAKSIANALSRISKLEVMSPHTNGFFVFLQGDMDALNQRAQQLTQETGLKLFSEVSLYPNSDRTMVELQVGHQHDNISDQEIVAYFEELVSSETSSS